jgi:putative membrane protein
MKKLETKEKSKEEILIEIALKNKRIHFLNEAKITGIYTKKLEELYNCYLDEIKQNESMHNEAEINTNFSNELKKLFDYIDWYDELADSEEELKLKSTENLLRFREE